MSCSSKENALDFFRDMNLISDIRELSPENLDKFNIYNERLTRYASFQYGLNPDEDKLFDVTKTDVVVKKGSVRDSIKKVYRVEPNEELFNVLDQLIEEKEAKQNNQRATPVNEEEIILNQYEYREPIKNYLESIQLDVNKLNQASSVSAMRVLAERLALNMGKPYEFITEKEARTVLESAPIKYNGEPAFFYAGTAYFVEENVSFENVLHEFGHPLIAAIRRNPDTRQLFENLYQQAKVLTEGKEVMDLVKRLYPNLKEDTDLFKEEVIVHALERKAVNQVQNKIESEGFEKFIKNLLYAIKQILRNIFDNKINVTDLDANTTLDELANKMLNEEFRLDETPVTEQDLVMFARAEKSRLDKLDNTSKKLAKDISAEAMINMIDDVYLSYTTAIENTKKLKKDSPQYKKLEKAMLIEGTTELLPGAQKQLQGYQTITRGAQKTRDQAVEEGLDAELRNQEALRRQSTNVVYGFNTMNNVAENIYEELKEIYRSKDYGSRPSMTLIGIYKNTIETWSELVKSTDDLLNQDFGIRTDHPFAEMLNKIGRTLDRSKAMLDNIYKEFSVDFYKEYTQYMQDFVMDNLRENLNRLNNKVSQAEIDEIYDKVVNETITQADIDNLAAKGASAKAVADFINHYNTYKITEDKIRGALTGMEKDVSWFNRMLEGYTSSNDPIVGGLAVYINDLKTEAQQEALAEAEIFRGKLEPLLKAIGYNPNNTSQVLDLVAFEDTVFDLDDKGNPVPRKVYTFLNEWKDYRHDRDKLRYDYQQARETGDPVKIAEAAEALRKFNNDYMYDEFKPEVYEADELFETPVGKLAWLDRQAALDNYRTETSKYQNELERFERYSTAQALWREYQKLYELTYADGTPKVDDPSKGIFDLSKAQILREYRERNRKYNEFVAKEGSLQTAYNEFINLIEADGIKRNSDEFKEKLRLWKKQNLRTAYAQEYYDSKIKDITRLKELQTKMNEALKDTFDVSGAYDEIFTLLNSFRDEQNQPIPSELGKDRLKRIKELQQQINDYKKEYNSKVGLTKSQLAELETYREMTVNKEPMSKIQKSRFVKLNSIQAAGLSPAEHAELTGIYNRLTELSSKEPTEYYMDALNAHLNRLGEDTIEPEFADNFINSQGYQDLLDQDDKLYKWHINNHVTKESYKKKKSRKPETVWERIMAHSISVPNNEDHILKTTVIDTTTGKEYIFTGRPNARHSEFRVKNEYRTIPIGENWRDYIGIYKDNTGRWLPRPFDLSRPDSAKTGKYVNEDYALLKRAPSTPRFQLLELLKSFSLQSQIDLVNSSKLYLDLPRFAMDENLEKIQSGKMTSAFENIKGSFKTFYQRSIFSKEVAPDQYMSGYNFDLKKLYVNTDLTGEEISYVPISGLYKFDINQTSKNVLSNLLQYQLSGKIQSKLVGSLSTVNSVLRTLENNPLKNKDRFSKQLARYKDKVSNTNKGKGNTYNRLEQVRSLIEREYFGRNVIGIEESNPWLNKLVNGLQSTAGKATLAVNIPSDLKNRYGQIVQNIIESIGGQYTSINSYALARPWAAKAMIEWSSKGIYSRGAQSLNVQLIQNFDPFFKTEEQHGRSLGRSFAKDMLDGSWMYDFRKFGEMEAAMQLFGSFMYHKYVDQVLKDGTVKPVRYMDAWEIGPDGVLKLKDGIDPEWGNKQIYHTYVKGESLQAIADKYFVTLKDLKAKNKITDESKLEDGQELVIAKGAKFKQFRNQFQTISRKLYGAYDKFGQAEGNKYLAFRLFFFMRKWAVPGFVNRFGMDVSKDNFGGERYDWGLGKTTRGYYISTIANTYKLIKSGGDYYQYMSDTDKADFKKVIGEGVNILLMVLAGLFLFGYDDDDEDRWEKIRQKSGPAFTPEFKFRGYMANHMLYLLLGVQQETSTYVPLPGLGLNEYSKFINITSPAFNSTIKLYAKIFEDVFNVSTFNSSAEYKKSVGPYAWQQEGRLKLWSHLLSIFGLSGRTGDPETLIKNFEKYNSKVQ